MAIKSATSALDAGTAVIDGQPARRSGHFSVVGTIGVLQQPVSQRDLLEPRFVPAP